MEKSLQVATSSSEQSLLELRQTEQRLLNENSDLKSKILALSESLQKGNAQSAALAEIQKENSDLKVKLKDVRDKLTAKEERLQEVEREVEKRTK